MKPFLIIAIAACSAYIAGYFTKMLRLPSLVGYMIVGVLLGTSVGKVFSPTFLTNLDFISDLALGFVAISIGLELSIPALRKQGKGIITIIFAESFGAFLLVTTAIYLFTRDLPLALIFGAMAPASAPAGTVAVIHEYRAHGPLTKALYAVVGFDDGLAIIIFGVAFSLAKTMLASEIPGASVDMAAGLLNAGKEIGLSISIGAAMGFVLSRIMPRIQQASDIIIISFIGIAFGIGISNQLHLSLILTNMMAGLVLVNISGEHVGHKVSSAMTILMPLLFVLFFCLAGAHLNIWSLPALGGIGIIYIIGRSTGLVGGAYVGAVLGKADDNIRKYLGLGILSQAGVAIGLALVVSTETAHLGSPHALWIGSSVLASVTATSIVFEIGGPILTKIGLTKAGEINKRP
ncbi:cation:proton antiporter [Myxococcota bacterium]|nr:cation:proton antiporter [Myxococcota bacterium]MBU1535710.1 cation:proton antiporter [Myxococcota bacterium]